jgi:predicted nucleic acid-binding protein
MNWNDKAFTIRWNDDQHENYTADEEFKELSERDLYDKMMKLIENEEEIIRRVRRAEDEVETIEDIVRSIDYFDSMSIIHVRYVIYNIVDNKKNSRVN